SLGFMRWSHLTAGNDLCDYRDPGALGRARSCPVRMSILSWELLLLFVFLGGAGLVVVAIHDGRQPDALQGASLRGHDTLLESVVFAPDGKTLITCGWDRKVRLWAVEQNQPGWGREIDTLPSSCHLFSVAISPDAKYLAAGGVDGLHVWSRD